jgi:HAD superfamily hydrolase (TIGR01509 family)
MIKCIYFDVGGVLIKDFSCTNKWQELKRSIGLNPGQIETWDMFFDAHETEVCMGQDIESLVPLMTEKFGLHFPEGYSFLHEFVDRFEKNDSIWPVISSLSKNMKLGMLTNMYPGMLRLIQNNKLMPKDTWDVIIDSSVLGVRKPQKEIFELAERLSSVTPEEILYVENGKNNIDAAKQFGWKTYYYDSSDYEKASKKLTKYMTVLGLL